MGFISLSAGSFTVRGTHTYTSINTFSLTVAINAADGRSAIANGSVTVPS